MANRDFFSFCTSLKPIELKALGELSHVRHLGEGTTLFAEGDSPDAIYIISRGVMTLSREDTPQGEAGIYLSRGDLMGAAEVLTHSARISSARACEPSSVQCVPTDKLDELVRRVPAFALYLAEQLSWRLLQTDEQYLGRSNCLEFSGNLRNFDIVAIVQTIYNSSKTGELVILNNEGESVAGVFFRDGRPICAQCHHLTGEEAFWQIFLHERMEGNFSFTPVEFDEEVREELPAHRGVDDMVINAVRQRDEFQLVMEGMPQFELRLHRVRGLDDWEGSPELLPAAKAIWEVAGQGQTRVEELFWLLNYCELTLYKALTELIDSQIILPLGGAPADRAHIVAA